MLDYYGSITKQSDTIKQDLLSAFTVDREGEDNEVYAESYILGLINDLGILEENYSVSGWAFFHFNASCDLIRAQIQRDVARAELAEKRLALGKACEWNETVRMVPLDIVEMVAERIE
jgi:hypothetical protein